MNDLTPQTSSMDDRMLLRIAREVSMDIRPIEDILESHKISQDQWSEISNTPQFQHYLRSMTEEWHSAINTPERVRLKSLAFVEEALPEFYARAHDIKETLAAKVEVLKTVAKFAGVGGNVEGAVSGERMVVTINLGADHQLRVEKDITPRGNEEDQ